MGALEICSMNTNGLGDQHKCQSVLTYLKNKCKGIIMLQETHCTESKECMWKELSDAHCYFSHGTSNSKGVATLIPKELDIHVKQVLKDQEGRFLILEIVWENVCYVIVNVYAPTKDKPKLQHEFISNLSTNIEDFSDKSIIWGGDMNCYLDPNVDKKGGNTEVTSDYATLVKGTMEHYDVVDIWRVRNPDTLKFTWYRRTRAGIVQSRIDYFFVSSCLTSMVTNVEIKPGIRTDHSLIKLTICSEKVNQRGKGFWKFNNSLLADSKYIDLVRDCIKETLSNHSDLSDGGLMWDLVKCKIRGLSISYSVQKRRTEKEHENNLIKEIERNEELLAYGNTDILEELESLKREFDDIQNEIARGIILRSKAKYSEFGEKNTRFFLNLEKRNHEAKHIKSLFAQNGETITDPKAILELEKSFYENLYTKDSTSLDENSEFLVNNLRKTISDETRELCDRPLDCNAFNKALMQMENNKSPGSDGLSVEFYKFFWDDIQNLVTNSLNSALCKNELSIEQRRGVITLIPKSDKDLRYIKNWRPITLLNTDYKILTKALADRLQVALKEIISHDQTGYIKGRYIGENIRVIDDIINYTSVFNIKGFMLMLDFEKAFDTVNIQFLIKALEVFKFGPYFCNLVNILYNNVSSCVTNNGYASSFFPVSRGIRQGCPLSAMLFLVVVELLADHIKSCKNINGIKCDDTIFLISQLADDTTLFLRDEQSVRNVMDVTDRFYNQSGLRLNKQKCEVFMLGNCGQCNNSPTAIGGVKCTKGPFKALGIFFSKDRKEMLDKNFNERLCKFRTALNIWKQRNLTLRGKITVIKSILLPIILYPCNVLEVPNDFIAQIDKIISSFLWNNKTPKVKYSTIIADIQDGGLRMPYFPASVQCGKIMWIKRLLEPDQCNWKKLAWKMSNVSSLELMCKLDQSKKPFSDFYVQVLESWYKMHVKPPKSIEEVCGEILLNNVYISSGENHTWVRKLYKKGIVYLRDIVSDKGELLSHEEMLKYNINTLEYNAMIRAIPNTWKHMLRDSKNLASDVDYKRMFLDRVAKMKSSTVYWSLIDSIIKPPTALDHWYSEFPFLHDIDIKQIYILPMSISKDYKIQCFQYKILNRIFPCNYMLNVWRIKEHNLCPYCDQIDTIEHYFYYCSECTLFWKGIEKWYFNIMKTFIPLKVANVLLGSPYRKSQDNVLHTLNYVVLHAKWFIYEKKRDCKKICLLDFLTYFKRTLDIEKCIAITNKKTKPFFDTWSTIYFAL